MSYDGFIYGTCYTGNNQTWRFNINGIDFVVGATAGDIAGLVPLMLPVKKDDEVYIAHSYSIIASKVRYYKP